MFRGVARWWNEPEQELLKLEFRRALRFFWSWTGLALIAAQLGLMYFLPLLQTGIVKSFSGTGVSAARTMMFVSPFYGIVNQIAKNAIWIYLLFGKSYSRFQKEQREQLLMLPVSARMVWPALLATPLVWVGIVAVISFLYATVRTYLEPFTGVSLEHIYLRYARSIASILQSFTMSLCLTFLASFLVVPKCSFSRFLWICLIVWFVSFLFYYAVQILSMYSAPAMVSTRNQSDFVRYMFQRNIFSHLVSGALWLAMAVLFLIRLRKPESWKRMERVLREREAA